jgi:maleate cis-trans isomerase
MSFEKNPPRARLGVIIPSSNRMAEPNFQRFAPDGVVPHFMRLRMSGPHRVPLDELKPRIADAASILGDAKCDVTVLHCTGTSMSGGFGAERGVIETIEGATGGRPGLTTATCLMAALGALGARRLVFLSETAEEGHGEKRDFMVEAGYDIVADQAACLAGSDESCITPPAFWVDLARKVAVPEADAIFISCANIQAIDAIAELEAELGTPVVTSNQVVLWHMLRTAGITEPLPNLGRLGDLADAPAQAAE